MAEFSEKDWKYLRSIHDEMLATLCGRINRKVGCLLESQAESEHAKYLKLYSYIHKADDMVAECFNDWRRSTMSRFVLSLRRHKAMTQAQFEQLTPGAQECVKVWESL